MSLEIGVLAIQGDVYENIHATRKALNELNVKGKVYSVITTHEINKIDALVIPGGESTTIGQLSLANDTIKTIKARIHDGMPVLGICAGMILLSNNASDHKIGKMEQPLLKVLETTIERNSFGRQNDSFEMTISMSPIGIPKFNGVFIRAPSISSVGQDTQILAKVGEKIVAVKKGNIIGTAFHPELTKDVSLHKYFVSLVK